MSIEDCRQAYRELSEEAFQQQNYTAAPAFRMPWNWDLKARFDSAALERGMKRIIVTKLRQDPGNDSKSDKELEDTLLKDPKSKCKVYVNVLPYTPSCHLRGEIQGCSVKGRLADTVLLSIAEFILLPSA